MLCLIVSETTSLCCHLPYMQSLPCDFESKSVSELKLLEPTDEGREVGMPSSVDILMGLTMGLCSYSLCSPGYIKKKGVYCSTGPCNMFGCNCDGECIDNKYVDDHLRRLRQESNNTNLTYEHLASAKRLTKSRSKTGGSSLNTNSQTPTTHSQLGSSVGHGYNSHANAFDYNGNIKIPKNMLKDAQKLGSITGNVAQDFAITFMSTVAAEYVSKKWLFPEPNTVNASALTTVLKEYNTTVQEIVMKFNKPFDQLNSTEQNAFVHKAQFMNLIDSNDGNGTQAVQVLRDSIYNA